MTSHREISRLAALQQLNLLDTDPSESFDRITRMAGRIFGLPIAAVSLTDSDRQWFKSRVGVSHTSIPRENAPCAQVAETCGVLVIPDLLADPTYRDSHLARSGVGFYAGAPFITGEGFGLGSMCFLGTEPRQATASEMNVLHDLAAMVMSQIELQHAFGRIDPISGLPNRTQFIEDLDDLARDQGPGQHRIAALIDLIALDQLNHATRVMGPTVVDGMVQEAAQSLRALLGPKRQAYHVGATQFAFLAPTGLDQRDYLELLNAESEQVRKIGGSRFSGTSVIGVAPFVLGEILPSDVLRIAQGAAQDARASDKVFSAYSSQQDLAYRRSFELLRDFEAALREPHGLRLVYQPRIELASGSCVGAEALLRWNHPTLGPISPGEFIPLVEKTVLATPTTAWVIDTALKQLAQWRKAGMDLRLSVNISAANLGEDNFAETVTRGLARHSIPAETLELEITESAVMEDARQALMQLEALAGAGIRLAIDDFGTGYSSLSYLQRLPVHVVKIDQSFMRDLACDQRKQSLVSMMIALTHHLGHRVVAEGVETQEVVDLLLATDCDEVQGYFFGRPMEAEDFVLWLSERRPVCKAA